MRRDHRVAHNRVRAYSVILRTRDIDYFKNYTKIVRFVKRNIVYVT